MLCHRASQRAQGFIRMKTPDQLEADGQTGGRRHRKSDGRVTGQIEWPYERGGAQPGAPVGSGGESGGNFRQRRESERIDSSECVVDLSPEHLAPPLSAGEFLSRNLARLEQPCSDIYSERLARDQVAVRRPIFGADDGKSG